ncbi:unnamed protein product [Caretta caretta]
MSPCRQPQQGGQELNGLRLRSQLRAVAPRQGIKGGAAIVYAQAMIIQRVKRQLQPPPGLPRWRFPTARYVFEWLENWAASKNSPRSQPTPNAVAVSMANVSEANFAPATEPSTEISYLLWAWFTAVPRPLCTGYEKQRPSPSAHKAFLTAVCAPPSSSSARAPVAPSVSSLDQSPLMESFKVFLFKRHQAGLMPTALTLSLLQ